MSKSLCCYAFEVLNHRLTGDKQILLERFEYAVGIDGSLPWSAPIFITWNKNGELRGCIGTFEDFPLEAGVKKFSLAAALHDSRFPAIIRSELNTLLVSVTLLANFTPLSDSQDWQVGKHGLKLSFDYDKKHYSGTFLPSVAEEQKWDKLDTLYHLLLKSDFSSVTKDKTLDFYARGLKEGWIKLELYEGIKSSLDYREFHTIRERL